MKIEEKEKNEKKDNKIIKVTIKKEETKKKKMIKWKKRQIFMVIEKWKKFQNKFELFLHDDIYGKN